MFPLFPSGIVVRLGEDPIDTIRAARFASGFAYFRWQIYLADKFDQPNRRRGGHGYGGCRTCTLDWQMGRTRG